MCPSNSVSLGKQHIVHCQLQSQGFLDSCVCLVSVPDCLKNNLIANMVENKAGASHSQLTNEALLLCITLINMDQKKKIYNCVQFLLKPCQT